MKPHTRDEAIRARALLIDIATRGDTINYTDFATRLGLNWNHANPNDRKLIGVLLGDVSRQEYAMGRPLITAVVVRKVLDTPGQGFLGLEGFPETEEFWRIELKRTHDFWLLAVALSRQRQRMPTLQ